MTERLKSEKTVAMGWPKNETKPLEYSVVIDEFRIEKLRCFQMVANTRSPDFVYFL